MYKYTYNKCCLCLHTADSEIHCYRISSSVAQEHSIPMITIVTTTALDRDNDSIPYAVTHLRRGRYVVEPPILATEREAKAE